MKRSILSAVVAAAAVVGMAPMAHADQKLGNYEVLSDRWANGGPSWIWAFYPCDPGNPGGPEKPLDCAVVSALPRPQRGAYYGGTATRVGNQFSFTSDVPDGLRCLGQVLPTRDTYTWDANTLAGVVESRYDVGCFNGPPGMNTWTFALQRY
jgi:hypothetical protein